MLNIIIPLSSAVILLGITGLILFFASRRSKKLSLNGKNVWLILHILFVALFFSGVVGAIMLALSTRAMTDPHLIHAAHIFINSCDHYLIIPGGIGSFVTGTWLAVRTHWGLTKHYWVLAKWVGNMFLIIFGSGMVRIMIYNSMEASGDTSVAPWLNSLYLVSRQKLFVGLTISVVVLIFLVVISYFKPWGKRKERQPS